MGEAGGSSQKLLGLVPVAQSDSGSTPGIPVQAWVGEETPRLRPFQSRPRLPHPFLGASPGPSTPPPANSKPTDASPPPGSVHIPWVGTALHADCVSRSGHRRACSDPTSREDPASPGRPHPLVSRSLDPAHSTAPDPPSPRPRPSEAPPCPLPTPALSQLRGRGAVGGRVLRAAGQ